MKPDKRTIDIIIVNYNSTEYLLTCLDSLKTDLEGVQARIFVEDNGSKDDFEQVRSLHPDVWLSLNFRNLGFARAVNRSIVRGTAPYILLLNPDAYIEKGFFASVLDYMDRNPRVAIAGPKVLNRDGSLQASARSDPTPVTALFGRASLLSKWFPNNYFTRKNLLTGRSNGVTPMPVDWVSGACMVVRREAVRDVGLLDERFFMYWEDADWCRRMRKSGWQVVYLPACSVYHIVGASSEHSRARSIFEFHKSSYLLFAKYAERSAWCAKPIVILGLAFRMFAVFCAKELSVLRKEAGAVVGKDPRSHFPGRRRNV